MPEFKYFDGLFRNSKVNAIAQIDTAGFVLSVSPAFTRLFGYTNSDITGQHFSIFFTEEDRLMGKPQQEISSVLQSGQGDDKNYLMDKDGQRIWVSGESILIAGPGGAKTILKIIQNIHEQKETQFALSRANVLQTNILETITDAVIVLDTSLRIISANAAFYKLLKSDLLALTDFAAFIKPYDTTGHLLNKVRSVITTQIPFSKEEMEVFGPTGEKVFEVSCKPMESGPGLQKVLLVAHDITAHRRAQIEREDIMGFVAHELRNPLANIMLTNEMMNLLLKEHPMENFQSLLLKSKNNIVRLNKMITELYDAEKINSGKLYLEMTRFDFDDMITEAIDTVGVLHPEYEFKIEGRAKTIVTGDRYRLIQVVTNYLNNGIKYSNGSTEIILWVEATRQEVIVCVEDKGLGISAGQLPFIFDRFFRAEKTRNLEGMGLGLYLCRRIMDAHNGRVWAESDDGKGSRFYLSLPINHV